MTYVWARDTGTNDKDGAQTFRIEHWHPGLEADTQERVPVTIPEDQERVQRMGTPLPLSPFPLSSPTSFCSLVRRRPGVTRPSFMGMSGPWSNDHGMQDHEYFPPSLFRLFFSLSPSVLFLSVSPSVCAEQHIVSITPPPARARLSVTREHPSWLRQLEFILKETARFCL